MAVDRALMPLMVQGQGMEIDVLPPEDDSVTVELPDGGVEIQLGAEQLQAAHDDNLALYIEDDVLSTMAS